MTKLSLIRRLSSVFLVFVLCMANVLAQGPVSKSQQERAYELERELAVTMSDVNNRRTVKSNDIPNLSKNNKERLKVGQSEYAAYEDFLKTPKSGVFKLLVMPACPKTSSDSEKQKCRLEARSILRYANSFSFRSKHHDWQLVGDLALRNSLFITYPNFAVSFITILGDVPIDDVSLESDGVKFMTAFQPAVAKDDEGDYVPEFNDVLRDGKFIYSRAANVSKNVTYALRSIGYNVRREYAAGPAKDVIVAFRVVRIDDNGDTTIIWKELQRKKGLKIDLE